MPPLPTELRRLLERKVVEARDAAEAAAAGALKSLAVDRSEPFPAMGESERELRRILRARARQLGDFREPLADSAGFALLIQETAYEHWHRMLFARFLAENGLLIHPEHGVAVTLAECAELACDEGEPDEWMLAARYASQMLPGIFRTDDPVLRVRFAPEGRQALESILAELPPSLFLADDSLGWVYQFWQSKKKDDVNKSERKIGGADLAPVTQLFTEHYMVAFLLENSLGAWWAAKHPESPLLKEWEYLRYLDNGTPAAGTFEGWPKTVAEVTVMDPCCGSGHFLVTAFEMLRRMREEEEGLSSKEAADAILRDNLFGLELDGRCVQIAVFALALAAWRAGGYRELPPMNIACCGVPARGTAEEWRRLARGDTRLADALERLYHLFKDADTLGSLIEPRRAAESDRLTGVPYQEVAPLLHQALSRYGGDDPAQQVFAHAAEDVATAAKLLAGRYTLVATNPPFLGRGKQDARLRRAVDLLWPEASNDLGITFIPRVLAMSRFGCLAAMVTPEGWMNKSVYRRFRVQLLGSSNLKLVALIGEEGFESFGIRGPRVSLTVAQTGNLATDAEVLLLDAYSPAGKILPPEKIQRLKAGEAEIVAQSGRRFGGRDNLDLLADVATSTEGLSTGDGFRYKRVFWELQIMGPEWTRLQASPNKSQVMGGCEQVILWEGGNGSLASSPAARIQGLDLLGRDGILVGRMRYIRAVRFLGNHFDKACVVVCPKDRDHLPAVYTFCTHPQYGDQVRRLSGSVSVATSHMVQVPFDLAHWTQVAEQTYPKGLPEPRSDDPTQWLFKGNIVGSDAPLHVAVARLLGYRWPDQEPDDLGCHSDTDGIVCLPPVAGERPGADRLLELLADAYGGSWSQSVLDGLLSGEGAADLATWLRDGFFASHCKLFHHRPFIWHIWDGRKDGFSALVNYHELGRKLLERLTYTTLQSWIDRQKSEAARGVGGAEARLAAATQLKDQLELILKGEPPHDIYVRWKPLDKQPIGWEPDINDGVRLNCRPFATAGVFRAKFTVRWDKDPGKDGDGSDRLNNLHYTIAEKLAARGQGGGT